MEKVRQGESNAKDCYELVKQVGEGSFGKVYLGKRRADGFEVAIKISQLPKMNTKQATSTLNEIRILSSVSSRHVVEYHEAFVDSESGALWVVMEYMRGGDLLDAINLAKRARKSFSEEVIWSYFMQLLSGVEALNELCIIHRDIKPANVFLTEDKKNLKIGDMNISKVIDQDLAQTRIGSPSYLAPEVWAGQVYDSPCDIWSIGCCVFELATLMVPFLARSIQELETRIKNDPVPRLPDSFSPELCQLVALCLEKDPLKRPTAKTLLKDSRVVAKAGQIGLNIDERRRSVLMETIHLTPDLLDLNLPKRNSAVGPEAFKFEGLVNSPVLASLQTKSPTNQAAQTPSFKKPPMKAPPTPPSKRISTPPPFLLKKSSIEDKAVKVNPGAQASKGSSQVARDRLYSRSIDKAGVVKTPRTQSNGPVSIARPTPQSSTPSKRIAVKPVNPVLPVASRGSAKALTSQPPLSQQQKVQWSSSRPGSAKKSIK